MPVVGTVHAEQNRAQAHAGAAAALIGARRRASCDRADGQHGAVEYVRPTVRREGAERATPVDSRRQSGTARQSKSGGSFSMLTAPLSFIWTWHCR